MARQIFNKTVTVDGIDIFYREAGDISNPSLLLLHGFPTSSIMFKNMMVVLGDRYHLVAPDYPGFGFSGFPDKSGFEYTFGNIASLLGKFTSTIGLKSFTIYLHDYGSPIGLRICLDHPEKIDAIIVQNGNSYEEGIGPQWDEIKAYWKHPTEEKRKEVYAFLSAEGTKDQYYSGLPEEMKDRVSPESWMTDWERMTRPGNLEMQYELNCDWPEHFEMFPKFREYFRKYQPRTLVVWGRNDIYFSLEEVGCYERDLKDVEVHIIEGAHMVLETNFEEVVGLIGNFMASAVPKTRQIQEPGAFR